LKKTYCKAFGLKTDNQQAFVVKLIQGRLTINALVRHISFNAKTLRYQVDDALLIFITTYTLDTLNISHLITAIL
jgi:hypothetical protein